MRQTWIVEESSEISESTDGEEMVKDSCRLRKMGGFHKEG